MLRGHRAFTPSSTHIRPQRVSVSKLAVFAKESRVGRYPIAVPKGVSLAIEGQTMKVKGPLGNLEWTFHDKVILSHENGSVAVKQRDATKLALQFHGISRTLASNMIVGVSAGFTKVMEMVGTGYRSSVAGQDLTLNVGYSNPRVLAIPEGVTVKVEKNTTLTITGYDKVRVGDFCATIRMQRPPEPYKGKGIRYQGEVIKIKEGKGAGGKKK